MTPIKYNQLDCCTLADTLKGKAEVVELADLSGKVPHAAYGGASKSLYTGQGIYVLERNGLYACDAWVNDVWQFNTDFSSAEAATFLSNFVTKETL